MRYHPGHALLVAALLLSGACQRAPTTAEPSGVTSEQFVTAYVELARAKADAPTPEDFVQLKAGILREHGVTEAKLAAFLEEHRQDFAYMINVWDSVQARLEPSSEFQTVDSMSGPTGPLPVEIER